MRFLLLILSIFIARVDIIAQNLELESIVPYEREMSDIWGWSHDNREYALVATTHYFSIVDVTDPENPVKLHQIEGPSGGPGSYWREMKTYGHYAYGVHDGTNLGGQSHGLVIVDLSMLPDSVSTTFWTNDEDNTLEQPFLRAHNIYIDEFGYAYLVGHNVGSSSTRGAIILDLNEDPLHPKVVGRYAANYVHDCFVRDNVMWASEGNNGFAAVDVSDKSNPVVLETQTTFGYSHNIWLSDDSKTAFTTDENSGKPIASFDVSDINDIKFLDKYQSGQNVIPHNVFVKNDFIIASYYRDGVIILDASQPDELVEMGHYDTSPNYSGNGFNGCWGVYPYLPSGIVLATDIERGLFVFTPSYKRATHIRGKVISAATRHEIYNASVRIQSAQTFTLSTDLSGHFKKGYTTGGEYIITVEKEGYETFSTTINLENGELYDEVIELISLNATPNDTIFSELPSSSTITICDENPHGVDANVVYSCDPDLTSEFGTWTIDQVGCITYRSNDLSGEFVDSVCFVLEDTRTGASNTNVVIVSIVDATPVKNNAFEDGSIKIIQNPVHKVLLLKNSIVIRAPLTLRVYDINSRLVINEKQNSDNEVIALNIDQLSKGIYVLEVISENSTLGFAKFIKD
ncbi:MAG: choice-of-anchor B family protein [Bacteroidetes bacterium]|nr:choice-of-anchor B family protein [Bacteroidota bacterium]